MFLLHKVELDIVAESTDGQSLLVGEAKLSLARAEFNRSIDQLHAKIARLPFVRDYRHIVPAIFVAEYGGRGASAVQCIGAERVFKALR